jgi:hyperpolarization activated cyclic nucleotide-gated potassium channel 2
MFDQYIHSLYWAYATCGTVAYGDIIPVTPVEKIYGFVVMIIAKIFVAFIYAEAATVVANSHADFTNYINKKALVKQWMQRIKLRPDIQHRTLAYYDLLWRKLKGYDDSHIMEPLSENLKIDIAQFLFASFAESQFFPKEEKGALLMIMRLCKIKMI